MDLGDNNKKFDKLKQLFRCQVQNKLKSFNIDQINIQNEENKSTQNIIRVDKDKIKNDINPEKLKKFQNYIEEELIFNKMPKEIYISTMTITCKINDIKFNCENIARYIDLSYDGIEDIICAYEDIRKNKAEKKIIFRSLPYIRSNKKEKKNKDVFYNQVSIHCKIKTKTDPVHIKLFKNGSIHITGCQTGKDIVEVITTIISKLKIEKSIINKETKEIIEKPFVSETKYLDLSCIADLKVNMINTNYVMPFKINLEELYKLLLSQNVECRYDKLSHSCVNIKYEHPEKKVSVFVFEKGSIVITGAKNGDHIGLAYDFINKILLVNYYLIVKKDININTLNLS
jgi:TATA-box binding protein (TBP) (component of TFIID and TFIIIB)